MTSISPLFSLLLPLYCVGVLAAQDPTRFQSQVDELLSVEHSFGPDKELVVFAGSSSIAMWEDMQLQFPEYNVVNHGFGGSHFSDLIHYYEELILRPAPDIVFIYEGDNDIAHGKLPSSIVAQADGLLRRIRKDLPRARVILISPKPSLARWDKQESYLELNGRLERYCQQQEAVEFADVWTAMLDDDGVVLKDIFIEDDLHLNSKGYSIWTGVIRDFLQKR